MQRSIALHCRNGHSKINKKMGISTPSKIATPQNFILKFGTRDYVWDITPHAHFEAHRFGEGLSTNA